MKKDSEKITVLGVGKGGYKIVSAISEYKNIDWLTLGIADTDKSIIKESKFVNSFLIGEEWTSGLGCGGDIIKGERAMAHKSSISIKHFIDSSDLLIIVGGFGGGTATGGAQVISRFAKEANIPAIFILTLPFAFEGHSKMEAAENKIYELVKTNNTVISIPNDLLYSSLSPSTPFEKAFTSANIHVAKAVLGVCELLRCNNLISVDLCDLHNVLSKQKTECGIGIGSATTEHGINRIKKAVDNLLASPLLGGRTRLNSADAVIISITGGDDLTIGEMQYAMNNIVRIVSSKAKIIVGANTDEIYKNSAQITVIPITFDKNPEFLPVILENSPSEKSNIHQYLFKNPNTSTDSNRSIHQPELPFTNFTRGIFTGTTPTTFMNEDLDIPTFQRHKINIDKGK